MSEAVAQVADDVPEKEPEKDQAEDEDERVEGYQMRGALARLEKEWSGRNAVQGSHLSRANGGMEATLRPHGAGRATVWPASSGSVRILGRLDEVGSYLARPAFGSFKLAESEDVDGEVGVVVVRIEQVDAGLGVFGPFCVEAEIARV